MQQRDTQPSLVLELNRLSDVKNKEQENYPTLAPKIRCIEGKSTFIRAKVKLSDVRNKE